MLLGSGAQVIDEWSGTLDRAVDNMVGAVFATSKYPEDAHYSRNPVISAVHPKGKAFSMMIRYIGTNEC